VRARAPIFGAAAMSFIFKHTSIISITHHVSSSPEHDLNETLHNHIESFRAKHTAQYELKAMILTAYGPLKESTQTSDEYAFGHKCQSKKKKKFVGHILNNTYIVFYLCILNYNTLSLIVPILGL
jgi:hypothetical protein